MEDLGSYQGIKGMRSGSHIGGTRIFTGSGSPSGVVTAGRIGDLYIDYTNAVIYQAIATGTAGWRGIALSTYGAEASVSDGDTITHGLGSTPTIVLVGGTVDNETVKVSAIGATTFTVSIKTNLGASGTTQTVYWEAKP